MNSVSFTIDQTLFWDDKARAIARNNIGAASKGDILKII